MGIDGIEQLTEWEPPAVNETWVHRTEGHSVCILHVGPGELTIAKSSYADLSESVPRSRVMMSQFLTKYERKK